MRREERISLKAGLKRKDGAGALFSKTLNEEGWLSSRNQWSSKQEESKMTHEMLTVSGVKTTPKVLKWVVCKFCASLLTFTPEYKEVATRTPT